MPELDLFSLLLGVVYDASLDGSLWVSAIERAADFLECMGGMIGSYDLLQKQNGVSASWGYDPDLLKKFTYYMSINPLLRQTFRLKVGEVVTSIDFHIPEDFYEHPAWTEWAKPQGIVDVVQATIEKTPLAQAVLAFSRHEKKGMVDERIRRRMTLIVPHFRRALMIGKAIDLARIESAMFADAIDGLAAAVFMVDAEGRLLHANASGEAMLADGDPFRVADRILTASSQRTSRDLAESFAAAALGDAAVEARGIAVPLSGASGQRFAAHVLPMTSGRRREAAHEAAAALFVRRVELEFPAYVRTMGEIYRLTASELRVLHVILDTGGVAPTALLLRLTENTVKTHLRHIFNKTGARSQVDLVKLVAGLSSPLAQG